MNVALTETHVPPTDKWAKVVVLTAAWVMLLQTVYIKKGPWPVRSLRGQPMMFALPRTPNRRVSCKEYHHASLSDLPSDRNPPGDSGHHRCSSRAIQRSDGSARSAGRGRVSGFRRRCSGTD